MSFNCSTYCTPWNDKWQAIPVHSYSISNTSWYLHSDSPWDDPDEDIVVVDRAASSDHKDNNLWILLIFRFNLIGVYFWKSLFTRQDTSGSNENKNNIKLTDDRN